LPFYAISHGIKALSPYSRTTATIIIISNKIKSKSQDYGDVSARNTARAPNSMQVEIKAEKSKKLKLIYKAP